MNMILSTTKKDSNYLFPYYIIIIRYELEKYLKRDK
jgi:hypothetical protein